MKATEEVSSFTIHTKVLIEEIDFHLFKGEKSTERTLSNVTLEKRTLAVSYAAFLCSDARSITQQHLNLLKDRLYPQEILDISAHVLNLIGKEKLLVKIKGMLNLKSFSAF